MMGSALTMASQNNNLRAALSPDIRSQVMEQEDVVIVDSDRDENDISDFNQHHNGSPGGSRMNNRSYDLQHRVPYTATQQDSISMTRNANNMHGGIANDSVLASRQNNSQLDQALMTPQPSRFQRSEPNFFNRASGAP